jgi:hypothetical protein
MRVPFCRRRLATLHHFSDDRDSREGETGEPKVRQAAGLSFWAPVIKSDPQCARGLGLSREALGLGSSSFGPCRTKGSRPGN